MNSRNEWEVREAVQREAMTWLGTDYHHQADVRGPGGGVDCLMLLVRVFAAVGCIPADFEPRPYAHQWHQHRSDELYLAGLERFAHELPASAVPQVGDVGVWRFGRTYSHAGIYVHLDGQLQLIHSLADAREVTVQLPDAAPLTRRKFKNYTLFPMNEINVGQG